MNNCTPYARCSFYELRLPTMSILVRCLRGRVDHVQRDIFTPAGWIFSPTPDAVRSALIDKPPSVLMSLGFKIYSIPHVVTLSGGVIQQRVS